MQRQAILDTIERHLSSDLSLPPHQWIPLNDVVKKVASDVRRDKPDHSAVATVIPIEQVAAFVDGHLDAARTDAVCRATLIDNGVVAELVAAVRARQTAVDRLPSASPSLTERLRATHMVEMFTAKDIAQMMNEPEIQSRRRRREWLIPLAAIAAVAIAFLFWPKREPTQEPIVEVKPSEQANKKDQANKKILEPPTIPLSPEPSETITRRETDAKETEDEVPNAVESKSSKAEMLKPTNLNESTSKEKSKPKAALGPSTASEPKSPKVVSEATAEPIAKSLPSPAVALPPMKWTMIAGLLGTASAVEKEPETASNGTDDLRFARVRSGASLDLDTPRRYRTPSLSVAIAQTPEEGRIILSENADVTISSGDRSVSMRIDLRMGSVAMQGLPANVVIEVRGDRKAAGRIIVGEESLVITRATAEGVELQWKNARLNDDQRWIDQGDASFREDGTTTRRVVGFRPPPWINQTPATIDSFNFSKTGDTNDLAASLDSSINRLASSIRLNDAQTSELSKLIRMRISFAGDQLFELLASPQDVVRRAAVEAIALLPKDDPRYDPVWKSINAVVQDPTRRGQIDGWMQLKRTGAQPSQIQLRNMIAGLRSPEPVLRGLSDAMLRSYVAAPPPLDPAADEATVAEAMKVYQEQLVGK